MQWADEQSTVRVMLCSRPHVVLKRQLTATRLACFEYITQDKNLDPQKLHQPVHKFEIIKWYSVILPLQRSSKGTKVTKSSSIK